MNEATYYRDHWLQIEPARLDAYDQMFRWRPEMDPLIASAAIAPGQSVLDYGCGPGWLVIELARRVGVNGHVHGVDVNTELLARAAAHVADAGVGDRVTLHATNGDVLPMHDGQLDRVVTKNVLEYVSDLSLSRCASSGACCAPVASST